MLNFKKNKIFKQMENQMDFELTKSQKKSRKMPLPVLLSEG
jgi:hypothetical protein